MKIFASLLIGSLLGTLAQALPSPQHHDARSVVVAAENLFSERASNTTSDHKQTVIRPSFDTSSCPGYRPAGPVKTSPSGFTLPLSLNGKDCHAYGVDIRNLTLSVVYEKPHQLHVHIYDTEEQQYQLPLDGAGLFTRMDSDPEKVHNASNADDSHLEFHHTGNDTSSPWGFWITRKNAPRNSAPLFDTRPSRIPTYQKPMNETMVNSHRNTTAMPTHNLIFENQYVQLSSALPQDANLYGLGERYSGGNIGDAGWRLNPDNMLQPFFTLDAGDPVESNMYGYHPVYMEVRNSTERDDRIDAHVVAFQNTAGLDVLMRRGVIQYRGIGGTLDLRFFSGQDSSQTSQKRDNSTANASSPQTAMEQYVQYVNLPVWNPIWSFGYHQLRWGYRNTSELKHIHKAMREADIPLETMWSDIDYLKSFYDFTIDNVSYAGLDDFVDELRKNHQHYIPIIDAAIPAAPRNSTEVYAPGTRGKELDVFLKNTNGTTYIGQVWPGYTYFVDEHASNAGQWWTEAYTNLSRKLNFSGIWNDMNEPSSFVVGSAGNPKKLNAGNTEHKAATSADGWPEGYDNNTSGNSGNMYHHGKNTYTGKNIFYQRRNSMETMSKRDNLNSKDHYKPANFRYHNSTQRYLWDPPYAIHNGVKNSEGPLVDNLNKKTVAMDTDSVAGKFYDLHNLDGSVMMHHTYDALLSINPEERPFIVGRSTYPGVGKYANHWLGDNYSKWSYMALQIQGILQFQLFGIPTVGADTCGFAGNTNEELCNRWMMLSAFVPFYRNHNVEGAISQEPFRWDSVANASRIAIRKRYELLPEIYTARARSSQRGTPMVKSLWMEFASASQFEHLRSRDTQYMLGSNLLVSPVLEPGTRHVKAYFPGAGGKWRNVFTFDSLDVPANKNVTIPAPISTINVHMRPSRALLAHTEAKYTIHETTQQPYKLLVNLDDSGKASGDAYIDDGSSMPPTPNKELSFSASGDGQLMGDGKGEFEIKQRLQNVVLMGVKRKPQNVTAQGDDILMHAHYHADRQLVNITNLDIDLNNRWTIQWS